MNSVNTNRQLETRLQILSALLLVVADIAATLAQFLPMKSVFILAAGEVPSFFPRFLIDAGPILAALSLVAGAGISATVASFVRRRSSALAGLSVTISDDGVDLGVLGGKPSSPGKSVRQLSSVVLVGVLFTAALVVSWIFALLVALWVVASGVVLAVIVHRGARKLPYPSGFAQFEREFRTWMNQSSLWSAVGAAIITLLLHTPALGLTGILLGAVVLRRFQQITPDVVPLFFSLVTRNKSDGEGTGIRTLPFRSPYDSIGSPVGKRLFETALRDNGLETYSWQVCGRPDRSHMAVLAREKETAQWRMLKLFASGGKRRLDRERQIREEWGKYLPSHVHSLRETRIAGLPTLEMTFSADNNPKPNTAVDRSAAFRMQLEWESTCLTSPEIQETLRLLPCPDPQDFLHPVLVIASRIRGPHTSDVNAVVEQFSVLRDDYLSGPRVLSTGKPDSTSNLLQLGGGLTEVVDWSEWSVSMFGATWTSSQSNLRALGKHFPPSAVPDDILRGALRRQKVHALFRALRSRTSLVIKREARALLTLLEP